MARPNWAMWNAVGAGLLGFPYGVPGGFLLCSTLVAAGTCELVTSIRTATEPHSWLVDGLTLLTGVVVLMGSVPVIGGLLYLAALAVFRRAGRMWRARENQLYATEEVVVVGMAVLVGIPLINGCFGLLMEAAIARSNILTLYKCSAELAGRVACVLALPMATAFAAGGTEALATMQDKFGLGGVELGAAAAIGWGTLGALETYQSALGPWGTAGGMVGPAVAAGVALSAGVRRGNSGHGKAGKVGAILGAALGGLCVFWSGRGTLSSSL